MCCDQSQSNPRAVLCEDAPESCECCIHELHDAYNFASSLHSIEHSNCEACMQHIWTPPNQMPAWKFPLQITGKYMHRNA